MAGLLKTLLVGLVVLMVGWLMATIYLFLMPVIVAGFTLLVLLEGVEHLWKRRRQSQGPCVG
jgi:hypothetical protein